MGARPGSAWELTCLAPQGWVPCAYTGASEVTVQTCIDTCMTTLRLFLTQAEADEFDGALRTSARTTFNPRAICSSFSCSYAKTADTARGDSTYMVELVGTRTCPPACQL